MTGKMSDKDLERRVAVRMARLVFDRRGNHSEAHVFSSCVHYAQEHSPPPVHHQSTR